MKRVGNLYNKIISVENLELADKKARKGKHNKIEIINHDKNRKQNIIELHNILKSEQFKTSKYSVFYKREPKLRKIHRLPYYPDRILHHAIMNILEPIFVSTFVADTYNCIKGRGIIKAHENLRKCLKDRENTKFCLKFDIKKFYENIDLEILKSLLRRKFKDKQLLNLLDEIITSLDEVPLGNYLSQYFSNFYLTYFDHWVKEILKVKYYFRYCDDICILSNDKKHLWKIFRKIKNYLEINLKLNIKSNYQVFPVSSRGIDFLGYKFFHTHILLRKSIKQKMKRTISFRNLHSYKGWTKWCNARNLERKYLNKFIMNTN